MLQNLLCAPAWCLVDCCVPWVGRDQVSERLCHPLGLRQADQMSCVRWRSSTHVKSSQVMCHPPAHQPRMQVCDRGLGCGLGWWMGAGGGG